MIKCIKLSLVLLALVFLFNGAFSSILTLTEQPTYYSIDSGAYTAQVRRDSNGGIIDFLVIKGSSNRQFLYAGAPSNECGNNGVQQRDSYSRYTAAQCMASPPIIKIIENTPTRIRIEFFARTVTGYTDFNFHGIYTFYPFNLNTPAKIFFHSDFNNTESCTGSCTTWVSQILQANPNTDANGLNTAVWNNSSNNWVESTSLGSEHYKGLGGNFAATAGYHSTRNDFFGLVAHDISFLDNLYPIRITSFNSRISPHILWNSAEPTGPPRDWNAVTMIFLDSNGSNSKNSLGQYALDYRNPDTIAFTEGAYYLDDYGDYKHDGFNEGKGSYEMTAVGNKVDFVLHATAFNRYKPAFEIRNYAAATKPRLKYNGLEQAEGTNFNSDINTDTGIAVVQWLGDLINANARFEIADSFPVLLSTQVVFPNGDESLLGDSTVQWKALSAASVQPLTALLYYDSDNNPGNGMTLIVRDLNLFAPPSGSWGGCTSTDFTSNPTCFFVWGTPYIPNGSYYLYVELKDSSNIAFDYSDASFSVFNLMPGKPDNLDVIKFKDFFIEPVSGRLDQNFYFNATVENVNEKCAVQAPKIDFGFFLYDENGFPIQGGYDFTNVQIAFNEQKVFDQNISPESIPLIEGKNYYVTAKARVSSIGSCPQETLLSNNEQTRFFSILLPQKSVSGLPEFDSKLLPLTLLLFLFFLLKK